MHRNIARAYAYLKREHDRVRAAHVRNPGLERPRLGAPHDLGSPSNSVGKTGARGGSRTHMRKNPRRILSPQRLPFRHPGTAVQS
jgi:hypothetical protein